MSLKKMIGIALLSLLPLSETFSATQIPQEELIDILSPRIEGLKFLTKNSKLTEAILEQNRKGMSLEEIKKIDKEWRAGTSPLIQELQNNEAGNFLKNIIVQQSQTYSEVFLTDINGANVAAYPATSDYWQGDEDKFIKCFNNGDGQIYVGNVEFDDSTQSNTVQISVPMIYGDQTIGVLVIGIKVSVIEAERLSGK